MSDISFIVLRRIKHGCTLAVSVFLLSAIGALLHGCGYQWQKPLSMDKALQPVYVSDSTALGIAIARQLMRNGIAVSKNPASAGSVLHIRNNERDSRSLSIGEDGRSTEYIHRSAAILEWQDSANHSLMSAPLYSDSLRIAKPDTPLAQSAESRQIDDNLTDSLAEQAIDLIRHHLSSRQPLSSTPTLPSVPTLPSTLAGQ